MLDSLGKVPSSELKQIDVFVAIVGKNLEAQGLALAKAIRRDYQSLGVLCHCGGGKFNNQLKKAYSSGASLAVILEDDLSEEKVDHAKIRRLDDSGESKMVKISNISEELRNFLGI